MDSKNKQKYSITVLYIISDCIFFNSSANIRNIALIKGFQSIGCRVLVINFENKHYRDEDFIQYLKDVEIITIGDLNNRTFNKLKLDKSNNTHFNWLQISIKNNILKIYNKVRIFDPYLNRVKKIKKFQAILPPIDLIISSSDPRSSHIVAKAIRKKLKINSPWVQYWGDPMSNDISSNKWMKNVLQCFEKNILKLSNAIIYPNQLMVDYAKKMYPELEGKIFTIPTSFFHPIEDQKDITTKSEKNEEITLGYFGGFKSNIRNINNLINVVEENEKYHLILAGGTDLSINYHNRIVVYPRLSLREISDLQKKIQILIIIENNLVTNDGINKPCIQIPGKMYHYAFTDKPILVICESNSLINEFGKYNRYHFCKNSITDISMAINEIIQSTQNIKYLPINDFKPEVVATKVLEIIEALE